MVVATIRARVVFPVPGGPKKIADRTRSSSIERRSAVPAPTTPSWPTNSSSRCGRSRAASGATSRARSCAASEKRSPTREVCSSRGRRGLLAAGPDGRRRKRLRALPPHRRAAPAAEAAGGADAPRRAPVPDRPPVLGAVAEARRGGDGARRAAPRAPRARRGAAAARPDAPLPAVRHRAAGHARADVAVGVPGDPPRPRPRLGLRLAGLPRAAPVGAGARAGAPRDPPRARPRPAHALRRRGASTRSSTSSPRR